MKNELKHIALILENCEVVYVEPMIVKMDGEALYIESARYRSHAL